MVQGGDSGRLSLILSLSRGCKRQSLATGAWKKSWGMRGRDRLRRGATPARVCTDRSVLRVRRDDDCLCGGHAAQTGDGAGSVVGIEQDGPRSARIVGQGSRSWVCGALGRDVCSIRGLVAAPPLGMGAWDHHNRSQRSRRSSESRPRRASERRGGGRDRRAAAHLHDQERSAKLFQARLVSTVRRFRSSRPRISSRPRRCRSTRTNS